MGGAKEKPQEGKGYCLCTWILGLLLVAALVLYCLYPQEVVKCVRKLRRKHTIEKEIVHLEHSYGPTFLALLAGAIGVGYAGTRYFTSPEIEEVPVPAVWDWKTILAAVSAPIVGLGVMWC